MRFGRKRLSYENVDLSVARRHRAVERVFAGIFVSAVTLAVTGLTPAQGQALEPRPRPQLEVTENGDYREARDLLARRKWVEAVVVLRAVLKKDSANLAASLDLVKALAYSGRREEALSVLADLADHQKGPNRRMIMRRARVLARLFLTQTTLQGFQDGLNLMLTQKYRLAQERFEKTLEQEPDNIEILTRLGQSLLLDGDFDSAAERLRLARKLGPFEPEVRLWLGRAMHQRGELSEAVEELRSARAELPGSELATVWLAEALVSSGQRSTAIELLDEDVRRRPLHVLGLLALARLRYQNGSRDSQALWSARKTLQIALSRLSDYSQSPQSAPDGGIGFNIRPQSSELKAEISKLLEQVEERIESASKSSQS